MAHAHGHDHHTVVERDGSSSLLIGLIALIVVGVLVWLFAFSGLVFDRGTRPVEQDNVNVEQPQAPPAPAVNVEEGDTIVENPYGGSQGATPTP